MFVVNGTDVTISREDTGVLTVAMSGDVPADGTTAIVTVRKNIGTATSVWEKRLTVQSGQILINLSTHDTDIAPGAYYWDIRLLYDGGDVYTPFAPAVFQIVEVVGDA